MIEKIIKKINTPWRTWPKGVLNWNESIHEMRLIKSPEEIKLIQKAVDITCDSLIEAMKAAEPGMKEFEIEAVIEYVFRKNGSTRPGFPSIVGSGPNSTVLHYDRNNRQTQDGDLVVMDVGAEYGRYKADVTRTIPISGKFTKEQKEIYEIVLRAQEQGIDMIAPGLAIDDIHNHSIEVIKDGLLRLGLLTDKQSKWQIQVWLMCKISHWLGLDVHDVGDYRRKNGKSRILEPGMVFTVEPGIYIRENAIDNLPKILGDSVTEEEITDFISNVRPLVHKYADIGVRIEDDILVTEDGHKNLSVRAPKKIEEIQKIMNKKSRLNF